MVPTWNSCPNGNQVPSYPAACTGDLLTAINDIKNYLFCTMSAMSVAATAGGCNLLMVTAGKVTIDTLANALINCVPTGTAPPVMVLGKASTNGIAQWLPQPSVSAAFIPDCTTLTQRLGTGAGGCYASYGSAPTTVFGNGANGLGYYIPAAGGGGGAIACADLIVKARDSVNGGCFPDIPEVSKILGINGNTVGYLPEGANRTALFTDANGVTKFGCLPPDVHCPASQGQIMDPSVNAIDGYRPQYRTPYRGFFYVNASQASGSSPVTLQAPGILNTLPLTLNREEGNGGTTWFDSINARVTIQREGWYLITGLVYARVNVPSTSSAGFFSVYGAITTTSSIHGVSSYRIGENTYRADATAKVYQGNGSTVQHLKVGEQILLRCVINQTSGTITWASGFFSGYLDGQSGLSVVELPGYAP